ncbi:MAG: thioesterase [Oceanospirillaceae bacterium]|nr:thioesterase [Oceanospirillaceae bacterium]HCI03251.1 thioesterase [Oceanospirillaceae bacterium]
MALDKDAELRYEDFPLRTYDKIRYVDTDRQGHVNNAMFSTYMETGRVEFMSDPAMGVLDDNASFVIANSNLNLLGEINWPGTVEIGTRVVRIGNSSVTLTQGLFQNGNLVATADTVIVQMNEATRKSHPLTDFAKQSFSTFM